MRIETLKLENFRCYGPETTCIHLVNLTTVIGANGSGKTAVLLALARLFGITSDERRIVPEDFHVPPGEELSAVPERRLAIELRASFPELDRGELTLAVPECFQQMAVDEPDGGPFCRIRLEATWTRGLGQAGFVEERISWICSDAEVPAQEDVRPMRPHERARFQVIYVPAARDPSRQLRNVRGTLLARLLNAVQWSESPAEAIGGAAEAIENLFGKERGIELIHEHLEKNWLGLHDGEHYRRPRLRFAISRIEEILRNAEMAFGTSEVGDKHDAGRLSDGLRSLFYFALVGSIFDIEQAAVTAVLGDPAAAGETRPLALDPHLAPILTVFAIEEPENHLSPHFLGRIMALLQRIATLPGAQVVLTSHSASIVGRVEPTDIRHVFFQKDRGLTAIRSIQMPEAGDEAFKFVREAVRSYPELYFARFVVLCEGDSEEILIPRLAQSHALDIDRSFVCVVPLGGRHVNHFWRLLQSLCIPYITLLDLDRERDGGGWGRVKYVCKQLIAAGFDRDKVLEIEDGTTLDDDDFDGMHTWDVTDHELMGGWIRALEDFDVFFSSPLDIDFLMLEAHPEAYKSVAGEGMGPRVPSDEAKLGAYMADVRAAVLGESASGETYSTNQEALFPWYRYLFLNKGKPTTHLAALISSVDVGGYDEAPAVLQRLVDRIKVALDPSGAER
ncbi:ATP-dependent nuclease [Tautonia sociabilis]|nr:AAA family ATPase [Tautonia sociabilis]